MIMIRTHCKAKSGLLGKPAGFTLIELLVAIGVSAVVLSSIGVSYVHMQESSAQQVELSSIQQNLRGVLAIMERELRMIGQDYMQSASFGVTDVRRFSITPPGTDANVDANGSPVLRMTLDLDNDGQLDAGETITYLLYDRDGDGVLFDLARATTNPGVGVVSGRQLLAEGIEALEFAYAFDNDGNGEIDRTAPPGNDIIWAVDGNNDGQLNSDLLGVPLGYTVPPQNIRAVQVWVLARTRQPSRRYSNSHQYSVGTQVIGPTNDPFRRWMLTEILHCRNM
jgi:prepilin-type N-terminal cleavage/methylation domain-containing protein